MNKESIFKLTKKDFTFEYFSGSGGGGQHRNRHLNSCRCKHPPSSAIGICQDHRSKEQNTRIAFKRMSSSKKFQSWLKLEIARSLGIIDQIENKIDREMKKIKVEIIKDGKWVEEI